MFSQLVLNRKEEVDEGVPLLRDVGDPVARFLDEAAPDMERSNRRGVRRAVVGALFLDVVVAMGSFKHGGHHFRLLRLHHVADIDKAVLPRLQRRRLGRRHRDQVGHDAAGNRRDDLLPQRRKRHDAEVDLVAARLLEIGDDLAERVILLRHKALRPPYGCGLSLRVGDIRARDRAGREQSGRPAQYRTPCQIAHLRSLPGSRSTAHRRAILLT